MDLPKITIYCDGACSGNPGPGGWGAILHFKNQENQAFSKEIYGSEKETTNNQMELRAAIEALSCLKKKSEVELYTDSVYVQKGITEWIFSWKKNNWKNAQKKPVKNAELWQMLDEFAAKHKICWKWVKGHNGNWGNEKADELACRGRDKAMKTLKG